MPNKISPISQKLHQPYLDTDSDVTTQSTSRSHLFVQHGIHLDTQGIEAEIRHDYLHNDLAIIAPSRAHRPYDTKDKGHLLVETALSPRLDDNQEVYTLKSTTKGRWDVKVVENKYPSLTVDNPRAYGKQEIVIDTPRANVAFASLPVEQIQHVFEVFKTRTSVLLNQNEIEYVLVFKNDGYGAGASLAHAHSQIFALPYTPLRYTREATLAEQYKTNNNRDAYDDIIAYEKNSKSRILEETSHFLVFCPYASQWPFEFWLMPKNPIQFSTELTQSATIELSHILKKYLSKLTKHEISYNMYLQNGASQFQRFCIKVCGRSNIWGGFEVATGSVINAIPPESAAKWYKR